MPNRTIFLNTIKSFESAAGFPIVNGEELEDKLSDIEANDYY